jgi:chemotaxis protein MotA
MIGVIVGVVAVILTFILKGVSPTILINLPSIMIVLVGTLGATIASFGLGEVKKAPALLRIALGRSHVDLVGARDLLVGFAERARRDGLLALEADLDRVSDPFLRRGLQMIIDGLEPETVETVLELDTAALRERHAHGATMFQMMAGYAPTFGILGAVMGLIAVMAHLSEPEKLGTGIQVAFIATLMAVGIANILFMPVAVALRGRSAEEVRAREMALTGILAIQAGDNPRIVAQKLDSFIPPKLLAARRADQRAQPATAPRPAEEAA